MRQDKTAQMIGQTIQRTVDGQASSSEDRPQYRISLLLGKQPGRRTFLATSVATGLQVVVKLLLFGPDFTWEDLKLFEREAKTLESLSHPAIPKYLDAFEAHTILGEGFVLVQTYIQAESLQSQVLAGRRFSERDLKVFAKDVLEILQYLHSQYPPVIHRDIKPSNILLGDRTAHSIGKVYLVDFGSVQTVASGGTITVVGTYGYMPPEQFGGRAVPASDLYSLGKTLTYLAIGVHPADMLHPDVERGVSRRVSFTAEFDRWIHRLSLSDLSQRTATASDALGALERMDEPASAVKSSATSASSTRVSNNAFSLAPVYEDFVVFSTSREMEIQFPASRVTGKIRTIHTKDSLLSWFVAMAVPVGLIAYIFGGVGLVLIALFLYAIWPKNKNVRATASIQPLSLKLLCPSEETIFLDLTTGLAKNARASRTAIAPVLPRLESISVQLNGIEDQSRIDFLFVEGSGTGRLCIRGKHSEIQWLCEHLTGWKNLSIKGYSPE